MSQGQQPAERTGEPSVALPEPVVTRRAMLAGAGAVGAAAALAACGSDDPPSDPDPGIPGALARTSAVEVGGGVLLLHLDDPLVVTQPEAGTFKAFSAICTHMGCPVARIADGIIECTCHDSQFSIEDGSVVQAAKANGLTPETQDPLPEVPIRVEGEGIFPA